MLIRFNFFGKKKKKSMMKLQSISTVLKSSQKLLYMLNRFDDFVSKLTIVFQVLKIFLSKLKKKKLTSFPNIRE